MRYCAAVVFGYFLGSFPTGYLVGIWLAGIDLRLLGSGSTGATNVLRHVGTKAAIVVFLIDVLKGSLAVVLPKLLLNSRLAIDLNDWWIIISGIAALIGHIWPIWLKGRGGKAVATSLGVLLGLNSLIGLVCLTIFLICFNISRTVSISSLLAGSILPILMLKQYAISANVLKPAYLLLATISSLMIIWRHRDNVKRLAKGFEPQVKFSRSK